MEVWWQVSELGTWFGMNPPYCPWAWPTEFSLATPSLFPRYPSLPPSPVVGGPGRQSAGHQGGGWVHKRHNVSCFFSPIDVPLLTLGFWLYFAVSVFSLLLVLCVYLCATARRHIIPLHSIFCCILASLFSVMIPSQGLCLHFLGFRSSKTPGKPQPSRTTLPWHNSMGSGPLPFFAWATHSVPCCHTVYCMGAIS